MSPRRLDARERAEAGAEVEAEAAGDGDRVGGVRSESDQRDDEAVESPSTSTTARRRDVAVQRGQALERVLDVRRRSRRRGSCCSPAGRRRSCTPSRSSPVPAGTEITCRRLFASVSFVLSNDERALRLAHDVRAVVGDLEDAAGARPRRSPFEQTTRTTRVAQADAGQIVLEVCERDVVRDTGGRDGGGVGRQRPVRHHERSVVPPTITSTTWFGLTICVRAVREQDVVRAAGARRRGGVAVRALDDRAEPGEPRSRGRW